MAMTLRLDEEQEKKLAELADRMHTSKAAITKQAIDEKYDRELHRSRVAESAAFFKWAIHFRPPWVVAWGDRRDASTSSGWDRLPTQLARPA